MKTVNDLYQHLGYWHNRFGHQVHLSFERRLKAYKVTVSQWCLMITLYSNRADTVKDIAKLLSLDIAAITRLGDRLEAKNLLIRLPDEEDRRLVKFTLTKNGANLVSKLSVEADKNDEAFYGALNDDELLTYQKLLAKLLNAAGTNLEEFCPDFCKKPQIKKTKQPKI